MGLLLGYDIGSSSVKAILMGAQTGKVLAAATSPEKELEIISGNIGWAEQHPDIWWNHVKLATGWLKTQTNFDSSAVKAIGISYQMQGLVVVDREQDVLRPAIIWCDSRAVQIGCHAARDNTFHNF